MNSLNVDLSTSCIYDEIRRTSYKYRYILYKYCHGDAVLRAYFFHFDFLYSQNWPKQKQSKRNETKKYRLRRMETHGHCDNGFCRFYSYFFFHSLCPFNGIHMNRFFCCCCCRSNTFVDMYSIHVYDSCEWPIVRPRSSLIFLSGFRFCLRHSFGIDREGNLKNVHTHVNNNSNTTLVMFVLNASL